MSLVFASTFFFVFFFGFLIWEGGGGGVLRHSAVQTDFEFEISGPLLRTHRSTPSRSHPGDLDGKYGVQASAKDFMATPFGPNPPPGDPTLSTLSQDRSSRSGSK